MISTPILSHVLPAHLKQLEAESIYIIREAIAESDNPVMLYSIGKDSAVMLHLARKAFYPSPPPFPLLHIDTRWKFKDMYAFRDELAKDKQINLLVYTNPLAIARDINPFDHGSALHTQLTKTDGLKQALDHYQFDMILCGARRDEEKSRAKERVFSFRSKTHHWDPKNQRPELWNLYNTKKTRGRRFGFFCCLTGQKGISGTISIRKALPLSPCISPKTDLSFPATASLSWWMTNAFVCCPTKPQPLKNTFPHPGVLPINGRH